MTTHIVLLLLTGIALLGMFYLPRLLNHRMLTVPIVYVAFGMMAFSLPVDLPFINPEDSSFDRTLMEYLTELIVIISLAAIGLKLDRKPSFRRWRPAWYLLGIAMPLTIAAVAFLTNWWLGFPLASAILAGAVLAPTDPVLAGNVQVGPPNNGGERDDIKFSLTLEAGLNDGLAFPFVYLALALVATDQISSAVTSWLWWDFAYRIAVGLIVGVVIGKLLVHFFFKSISNLRRKNDTDIKEGFFVLGAILLTYALTEMVEGYGFLAVFIAAVTSRQQNFEHEAHERSYHAIDQVEQALLGTFLIAFGGSLITGGLDGLTWQNAVIGMLLVLVIRPLSGLIAFAFCDLEWRKKIVIGFFGIRGIGSIYYLAYAQNHSDAFPFIEDIWALVNFTILFSIIVHGISVRPLLNWAKE